jgi:hypothetical protein
MMANSTSDEKIQALVQAELFSNRRWLHRITLVAASTMLAIILALWTTEPKPMLLRLHVSFAIMSVIAIGWILVLASILVRKNCPTVWDRIATAWMSVVGCSTFAIASLLTTWLRGDTMAMLTLAMVSGGLLSLALFNLRNAYRWQEHLQQRLSELGG